MADFGPKEMEKVEKEVEKQSGWIECLSTSREIQAGKDKDKLYLNALR